MPRSQSSIVVPKLNPKDTVVNLNDLSKDQPNLNSVDLRLVAAPSNALNNPTSTQINELARRLLFEINFVQ